MHSTDYYQNKINQQQEKLDMVYQTINNFKMPYKYFKKLNILPLDIVEGEIDKYFDITTLILENYQEAKEINCKIKYMYENYVIDEYLRHNFLKYYNNFPYELFNNNNHSLYEFINSNYKKYKEANVITPLIDKYIRENLDNTINNIISNQTNKIKNITQQIIEIEKNKKYKIPIHKFPIDSKLLITHYPYSCYSDIIIVKICKKIIKYQNRRNPVVRQFKITELQAFLDNEDYKLVDRFDSKKQYCLDHDDNIYLNH